MDDKHVVVTGIGLIGSLGRTADEFTCGWQAGECARLRPLPELAGTPLAERVVAELPAFDAAERLGRRRMLKFMSDAAVLGCLAAREALQAANAKARFPAERIGLYAGSGLTAANVNDVRPMMEQSIDENGRFSCRKFGEYGLAATNPLLSFKILANMPPCLISVMEGIQGPNLIFTPWEGQAAAALIEGWRAVTTGETDCALVGAADTPAYPSTFAYLVQSGQLGKDEYPASGAAYLVLESAETAARDGIRVHGRIKDMRIGVSAAISDPLAARAGRTFAAAPALLLGLACGCGWAGMSISGVDGQEFRVELAGAP